MGLSSPSAKIWLGAGLAGFVALCAIAIVVFAARPDGAAVEARLDALIGPPQPAAQGSATATPGAGMEKMIAQLQDKVRAEPNSAEAWQNLGWAFMHIHQPAKAAEAYRRALALSPGSSDNRSALAEATIQSGSGKISEETLADLRTVVAADPSDARARFYLALYKDQQGDHRGAVSDWVTMIKSAPADAGWTVQVRQVVEQVAKEEHVDISRLLPPEPSGAMPGPDAQQMEAAGQMSAAERDTMIRGMVDRLAAELKSNPHDMNGWQRLIHARIVLGQKAEAAAAYQAARGAFAKEPEQLGALDRMARALGIGGHHG